MSMQQCFPNDLTYVIVKNVINSDTVEVFTKSDRLLKNFGIFDSASIWSYLNPLGIISTPNYATTDNRKTVNMTKDQVLQFELYLKLNILTPE